MLSCDCVSDEIFRVGEFVMNDVARLTLAECESRDIAERHQAGKHLSRKTVASCHGYSIPCGYATEKFQVH